MASAAAVAAAVGEMAAAPVRVGDGGGEHVGMSGVHKTIAADSPAFVGRRCLAHMSWRVSAAGLDEMETYASGLKSLAFYLRRRITWTRCRGLACQPATSGGTGALREGSHCFVFCLYF